MIATGIEEGVPTRTAGQGPANWQAVHAPFGAIVDQIPRTATRKQLEPIADELSQARRRRAQSFGNTCQIRESKRQ